MSIFLIFIIVWAVVLFVDFYNVSLFEEKPVFSIGTDIADDGGWNRGIATKAVRQMTTYLCDAMGVQTRKAYVMPENIASQKVLLKNGFVKEADRIQGEHRGESDVCRLDVFTYCKE